VFSPDGQRLASGSGNTVKILEARTASGEATGKELQALKGHTDKVWSVA
jgi:WD40 repeat protein